MRAFAVVVCGLAVASAGCGIAFGNPKKPMLGMGLGLQPGVGHFEIVRPVTGEKITRDGRVLHIQMDIRTERWSLDIGVEYIDLGVDAQGSPLLYNAWPDLLLRRRIRLREGTHMVAGGGVIFGCINEIPLTCSDFKAKALRATVGIHQRVGDVLLGPVVLRVEAATEAGENSVRQTLITAGLEFWFDVNRRL